MRKNVYKKNKLSVKLQFMLKEPLILPKVKFLKFLLKLYMKYFFQAIVQTHIRGVTKHFEIIIDYAVVLGYVI